MYFRTYIKFLPLLSDRMGSAVPFCLRVTWPELLVLSQALFSHGSLGRLCGMWSKALDCFKRGGGLGALGESKVMTRFLMTGGVG